MAKIKATQPVKADSAPAKSSAASSVFDVAQIRELIELMQTHDLCEVDLKQADQRVRLRRGAAESAVVSYAPVPVAQAPVTAPAADIAAAPTAHSDNSTTINSPTIGTFYASPKPDAAPFVKVGDMVSPETIVCLVEAMKMFNEIPAGVSGRITECLVKSGDPVDNNKPLFRVQPA